MERKRNSTTTNANANTNVNFNANANTNVNANVTPNATTRCKVEIDPPQSGFIPSESLAMARRALLLLAVLRLVACTIDEQLVAKARAAGLGTLLIATSFGCTQRRVQQILAAGGAPSAAAGAARTQRPQPSNELLVDMVEREIRRHGDYYGVQMLLGALRQWQPEYHFPRRAVAAAAATLRPMAYNARR
jgi:hypothetical protein